MAKLKLVANPTFTASVPIPLAGGQPVKVQMTFRHRTRSQLDEWLKTRPEKSDAESVLDMVDKWELEETFDKENAELLLENYIGAARAIFDTYVNELIGARLGN